MPPTTSSGRLIAQFRDAGFDRATLRTGDLSIDLQRAAPASTGPPAVAPRPRTVHRVTAPAPGVVTLSRSVGSEVTSGDQIALIQVNRRAVPLVVERDATIATIEVDDGAFVGYGEVVLTLA